MGDTLGWILLIVTVVSLIVVYTYIHKKKIYGKDKLGLIMDSWEVIGLVIALVLVSLVLIFKI